MSEPDALDAQGRQRPRFLLAFPDDPELTELRAAFERGDFSFVRKHAPALIDKSEDPAVRAAARELRRRIDPDPQVVWLLALALGLLAFLLAWTYWG
jgi:hypothetical protein